MTGMNKFDNKTCKDCHMASSLYMETLRVQGCKLDIIVRQCRGNIDFLNPQLPHIKVEVLISRKG